MLSTWPTSTSLNLIFVLPASSPSAVENVRVTTGPFSLMALNTSHPPTRSATMGTIHTRDMPPFFLTWAGAARDWASELSVMNPPR